MQSDVLITKINCRISLHDQLSDLILLLWSKSLPPPCISFYQWASCQEGAHCWLITSFIGFDCSLRQARRLYLTVNNAPCSTVPLKNICLPRINSQVPWSGKPDKHLKLTVSYFHLQMCLWLQSARFIIFGGMKTRPNCGNGLSDSLSIIYNTKLYGLTLWLSHGNP